jgi:uncharacterized membrane protein YjfL (UPF0719 family)
MECSAETSLIDWIHLSTNTLVLLVIAFVIITNLIKHFEKRIKFIELMAKENKDLHERTVD